jgi:HTH-type transcriptional regulator, sugar sensing transcriptional regulator
MISMDIDLLEELGLSKGERRVYSAVLGTGVATINQVHEKTGIERRNIYDILNKLIEKGYVGYTIEHGKRTYKASNPGMISDEIGKRRERLGRLESQLPEIKGIYEAYKPSISAEIYRGRDGIKSILEDSLNYDSIRFIGGSWYVPRILKYYWPRYNKRRIEAGIPWYNLVRYENRNDPLPDKKLMHVKVLPKEFSGNPVVVYIYGNKIANVSWEENAFSFVIENKEIAENYLRFFKYLWGKVALPYSPKKS